MANCGQACPYNTLDGCKVKEYNAICPLTNMATPVTEYRMTNADRIKSMGNDDMARTLYACPWCHHHCEHTGEAECLDCIVRYLQQPAECADNG